MPDFNPAPALTGPTLVNNQPVMRFTLTGKALNDTDTQVIYDAVANPLTLDFGGVFLAFPAQDLQDIAMTLAQSVILAAGGQSV